MDLWKKNLAALYQFQSTLAAQMEEYAECDDLETVYDMTAKDGNSSLVLLVEGKEHIMNSRFRPLQEAVTFASQFDDIKDYSVGIFFGFGNGYFAREVSKKGSDKVHSVYYEPNLQSFIHVMHQYDISDILSDSNVRIYVEGINEKELSIDLPMWLEWSNLPLSEIYSLPKYKELYQESYRTYIKLTRDVVVRAHLTRNTMTEFAKQYLHNSIHNLRFLFEATSAVAFLNVFPKDMPAILVSAGPSLAKNISLLKEAKGQAFIVCVDTALRRLIAEDIEPDAVMSVDPRKWAAYREDFIPHYERIMWITETTSNANLTGAVHSYRNVYLSGEELIADSIFERCKAPLPNLPTGGSVANSGFSLLAYWGFETIIMIGQDLALTGNRRYSDVETDACQEALDKGYDIYDIEGYNGDTVKTRDDYLAYLKWFEGIISANPTLRVINATEGGAMIHGATNMTLREALNTYALKEYDIRGIIDSVPRTFNEEQKKEIEEQLRNLPNRAKYFMRHFKNGKTLAERALTLIKRDNRNESEYNKIQKQLSEVDKAVSNELEFILISNRACEVDQKITRNMVVDADESLGNDEAVLQSMVELYQAFYDAAVEMKEESEAMVKGLDEEGYR